MEILSWMTKMIKKHPKKTRRKRNKRRRLQVMKWLMIIFLRKRNKFKMKRRRPR
jgi:hypothetical protein